MCRQKLRGWEPLLWSCLECQLISFLKQQDMSLLVCLAMPRLSLPSARTDERSMNNWVSCLQSWLRRLIEVICPLINYFIFSPFVVLNRWTSFLLPTAKWLQIAAPLSFLSGLITGFWAMVLPLHLCGWGRGPQAFRTTQKCQERRKISQQGTVLIGRE